MSARAGERPPPPATMDDSRPRVVVVDDDAAVRGWLVALMRHTGFEVAGEAVDGVGGVNAVLAARPDVVLIDLHMPGMGGIEAARAIRAQEPNVQVIVFTTYEDDAHRGGASGSGVYAYLVKGCPDSLIEQVVRKAAEMRRGLDARAAGPPS